MGTTRAIPRAQAAGKAPAKRARSPTPSSDEEEEPVPKKKSKVAPKVPVRKAAPKAPKKPVKKALPKFVPVYTSDEDDGEVEAEASDSARSEHPNEAELGPPVYEGTFDIYAASFDKKKVLKVYLPRYSGIPSPAELYEDLIRRQEENQCTGRVNLPSCKSGLDGIFKGNHIDEEADKPEEGYSGTLAAVNIYNMDPWKLEKPEMDVCESPFGLDSYEEWDTRAGPGVNAVLEYPERDCGVNSGRGYLRMRRLWARESNGELKEVFEGYFNFGIELSQMSRHRFYMGKGKDHNGPDLSYTFAFWAIRARKGADGKEISVDNMEGNSEDDSE
ncbi:hypothetical protein OF83DRAFT_1294438 [Amylostereum chailletii]|nr:hypothetical protein OF83DRAFT_1294438 [Amylostereum chailletii]